MTRRGLGALAGLLLVIAGAVALAWSRGVGPFASTQDDAAGAPSAKAPGHVTDESQATDAALAAAGRRTSTRDAAAPAGAAARPTTLRVFATVNNVPRSGVTVRVRRWDSLEVLATKETDAQGTCEFPATDLCDVEVEAWAAGLCPCTPANTEFEWDTNVARLELRPGREVVGRVIEEGSGAPVPGASVVVNDVEVGPTAADGRFRVSGLESGVATEVTADHVGFAPRTIRVRAAPPDVAEPPLELALERCATISGIVRDPEGNVADAAWVFVTGDDPGARLRSAIDASPRTQEEDMALERNVAGYSPPDNESARTAADGSFTHPLPPGRSTAWVWAAKNGFGPSPVTRVDVVGAARPIEFRLQRAARLEIEVVGPHGPCAGASLRLVQAGRKDTELGTPASFDNLSDEPAWLHVGNYGLRSVVRRILPVAGATTRVTVSLDEGRVIEGLVVDESGAPVGSAGLFCGDAGRDADLLRKGDWLRMYRTPAGDTGRTDAQGRFRLTGLDGRECYLGATAEDGRLRSRAPVRAKPGSPPVRIIVYRGATVRARFVSATGTPFAGAVWCEFDHRGDTDQRQAREVGGAPASAATVEFFADGDGDATLVAFTPGHAWVTRAFVVRGSTDIDLGTITFQRGTRVVGRVTDRVGRPVGDCDIISTACRYAAASDGSDVHGRFALDDFPPPPFELELYGEHILSARVRVTEVPADGLRLVVTRRGRVRGQVVDADGAPAVERLFYLRRIGADAAAEEKTDPDVDHDDPWQSVVSGPDGRFEQPVEPGTWAVRTDDDEAETSPALQTFTLTDGETRDVKIVWPADAPK